MKPSVFADPDNLPGVVLEQDFAGFVRLAAQGYDAKSIETRRVRIHYRGPLVIIAGLGRSLGEAGRLGHHDNLARRGIPIEAYHAAVGLTGVAVALFDVADCRWLRPEDQHRACFFEARRFAWMASRIRPLKPFPVKGAQGFVRVPRAHVLAAIEGRGGIFCPGCGLRHGPGDAAGPFSCSECGRSWRVGDEPAQAGLFEGSAGR